MGFPMKELIFDMAGGMRPGRKLKAVIPGGSSVPIMTAAETEDCLMDYEGIVARGSMLGSAGFIVMDDSTVLPVCPWPAFMLTSPAPSAPSAAKARRGRSRSWNACWPAKARKKT